MSRIDFVSTMDDAPWGGSEDLWSQAALKLRGLGHDVAASVFSWPSPADQMRALASAGVALSFRPLRPSPVRRIIHAALKRVLPGPLNVSEHAWLRKRQADLVVISQGSPWDGVGWMLACRQLGRPLLHNRPG